jgi:hypothetical protein
MFSHIFPSAPAGYASCRGKIMQMLLSIRENCERSVGFCRRRKEIYQKKYTIGEIEEKNYSKMAFPP